MDRLFVLLGLLLLLAIMPMRIAGEENAQPVFFSLLFPNLMPDPMPEGENLLWYGEWFAGHMGEAVAL